jgi:mannose/fructose/N-acetylgalactosamine-specific phosphotransferase system component IID
MIEEFIQSKGIFFILVYGIVTILITFYQLYLNYKQARVSNQMKDLLNEVKEIKELLSNK